MPLVNASSLAFAADRVAVALTEGRYGHHLGVAFHTAKEGAKLLHLAWHKHVKVDNYPSQEHCWVACVFDAPPRASAQLVACIRGLARKKPQVGYGFLNILQGPAAFGPTGSYTPPKGADGFTCSTFIAEIFRGYGFPLVDISSWEPESSNVEWAEQVYSALVASGADEQHLKAVRGNIKGIRVRPDEVAAAADLPHPQRPASFAVAKMHRQSAGDALVRHCRPTPSIAPAPQIDAGEIKPAVGSVPRSAAPDPSKSIEAGSNPGLPEPPTDSPLLPPVSDTEQGN